ncbi:MAG: SCO1664 family protein [Chloroflexi bacterium]|nr:SCO1664 family protein [Chloroflexota bacterium]
MTLQDAFHAPRGPHLDGLSEDDVLELLRSSEIGEIGLHPSGSNYVFIVRLETDLGGEVPLLGVYKPQAGERPLRDFPRGLHRRERASYVLSRSLGWPAIPPTVIRDGPHGEGSVQLFIHADADETYFTMRDEQRQQFESIAGFDILVNNADRKGGACLKDADGKVWAIDQGLTFNPYARVRTVMFEFCGQPFSPALVESLRQVRSELADGEGPDVELGRLLSADDLDSLCERMDRLMEKPEFPVLDEYYNVPWPLV